MENMVGDGKNIYRALSKADIARLHQATLEVFEQTGIEVLSEKGLKTLEEAGSRIDWEKKRAYVPAELVEKCLASAPKEFTLGARNEKNDLALNHENNVYARNGGGPGHVEDVYTGEVHDAKLSDVRDYARLVDALPNLNIVAPIYGQDTPVETRDIRVLGTLFGATSKHINMRLLKMESLPYILRMAEAMAGSKEALRARPLITMLESPIAPLKVPEILIETVEKCGEYGVPVEICSMPITGATGPITLAGSLLMSNIEMIAGIIFSQLAHPGAPVIFTPRIMVMDMKSGHALTGSVENALLASAGVQLAREGYGIPVNMHGPYTDSVAPDFQSGVENTYFTLMPGLAGASILTGFGHREGGLFVSHTQLVMDHDLMGIVKRFLSGMPVDDNTLGLDAIAHTVTEGSVLKDRHTLRNLRKYPLHHTDLFSRQPLQNWIEDGSKTTDILAREKAIDLLEHYEPEPLPEDKQKEIDDIIRIAAQDLEK